jgi:F-type H+-transporting ATPase subunit epsilon
LNGFVIQLRDSARTERIEAVATFVGEDGSGSFGILPGHARFMTALVVGLARFRVDEQPWQYLAVPGALLYFRDNVLTIITRHYLRGDDYTRIASALEEQLLTEEEQLRATKQSLHRMEEEILRRMWEMGRRGV